MWGCEPQSLLLPQKGRHSAQFSNASCNRMHRIHTKTHASLPSRQVFSSLTSEGNTPLYLQLNKLLTTEFTSSTSYSTTTQQQQQQCQNALNQRYLSKSNCLKIQTTCCLKSGLNRKQMRSTDSALSLKDSGSFSQNGQKCPSIVNCQEKSGVYLEPFQIWLCFGKNEKNWAAWQWPLRRMS